MKLFQVAAVVATVASALQIQAPKGRNPNFFCAVGAVFRCIPIPRAPQLSGDHPHNLLKHRAKALTPPGIHDDFKFVGNLQDAVTTTTVFSTSVMTVYQCASGVSCSIDSTETVTSGVVVTSTVCQATVTSVPMPSSSGDLTVSASSVGGVVLTDASSTALSTATGFNEATTYSDAIAISFVSSSSHYDVPVLSTAAPVQTSVVNSSSSVFGTTTVHSLTTTVVTLFSTMTSGYNASTTSNLHTTALPISILPPVHTSVSLGIGVSSVASGFVPLHIPCTIRIRH
ncbi:hypothetical protein GQ43DRAFT_150889 [Delitschia confertaspora ATCC 74209]|uniref:Uncharacterized protein n=1 Tax=Delitschia confertaspora ATCC 74209 TaxID=1513339 RepID=A0A9P4JLB4_9PLEO|nr:hypothetical protein GQ43DRAFT_150889 [Delitschia confertaspora ATCC 74209]